MCSTVCAERAFCLSVSLVRVLSGVFLGRSPCILLTTGKGTPCNSHVLSCLVLTLKKAPAFCWPQVRGGLQLKCSVLSCVDFGGGSCTLLTTGKGRPCNWHVLPCVDFGGGSCTLLTTSKGRPCNWHVLSCVDFGGGSCTLLTTGKGRPCNWHALSCVDFGGSSCILLTTGKGKPCNLICIHICVYINSSIPHKAIKCIKDS